MFSLIDQILDLIPDDYEFKSGDPSKPISKFPAFVVEDLSNLPNVENIDGQTYDNKYRFNFYILNLENCNNTEFESLANETTKAFSADLPAFEITRVDIGRFQVANRKVKGYYVESSLSKTSELFSWAN